MAEEMMKVLHKRGKTHLPEHEIDAKLDRLEKSMLDRQSTGVKRQPTTSSEFSVSSSGVGASKRSSTVAINAIMSLHPSLLDDSNGPWLINNRWFHGLVCISIVSNCIQMGLATDLPELTDVWQVCEHVFTAIFAVEMFLKIGVLRLAYFADSWNRIDFVLVILSIVDNWILALVFGDQSSAMSRFSVLRVLRILRIARMARLLKVFKELWIILKGIVDSLRTIFWVVSLLLLTLYSCSILCVEMMGRKEVNGEAVYPGFDDDLDNIENSHDTWNNYVYFGTIFRSMYTLFNVVTLTEFSSISRPMAERQPGMTVGFVIFIVFTTFGIVNVIVGVIVDNTMEAAKSVERDGEAISKEKKLNALERIRDIMFDIDADSNGIITFKEVKDSWDSDNFKGLLQDINLPSGWTARELFSLLDQDGDMQVNYGEFIKTFYRLLLSDPFQQICCTHASLNDIRQRIRETMETRLLRVETMEKCILSQLGSVEQSVQQGFQDMRDMRDSIESINKRLSNDDANAVEHRNKGSAHESGDALKGVISLWGTPTRECRCSCALTQVSIPNEHDLDANGAMHQLKLKSSQQEGVDAAISQFQTVPKPYTVDSPTFSPLVSALQIDTALAETTYQLGQIKRPIQSQHNARSLPTIDQDVASEMQQHRNVVPASAELRSKEQLTPSAKATSMSF